MDDRAELMPTGIVSRRRFLHQTSVLRMIEWRWGLEPLTKRDATANNLAEALDFKTRPHKVKQFRMPTGPFGQPCLTDRAGAVPDKWLGLLAMSTALAWK